MPLRKYIPQRIKRPLKILLGRDLYMPIQRKLPTRRHGSDYGGWLIYPEPLNQSSIVYSFGIGSDISFDLALIEHYGTQIYAFDPTPGSIEWLKRQALPDQFHFYAYGVADLDGQALFYPPENPQHGSYTMVPTQWQDGVIQVPFKRLQTIMQELGHQHIDLLKMDIEGAEYAVIEDIVAGDLDIRQLLVEFHHRFKGVGVDATRQAIRQLNRHGYQIFAISPSGEEYSFIREG